jgi:hypothetical protein
MRERLVAPADAASRGEPVRDPRSVGQPCATTREQRRSRGTSLGRLPPQWPLSRQRRISRSPSSDSSDELRTVNGRTTSQTVTIATRPLWRLRLARDLPRYFLYALCAVGLIATARFAIAPPRPAAPAAQPSAPPAPDLAAEGFASLFARRYLTWDASQPQVSEQLLGPFTGPGIEPDAGFRLPATGEQRVTWTEVVQARHAKTGEHVYTVAAQTDTAGLVYLTVGVVRKADGSLALAGYPAFVGAPAAGPAEAPPRLVEVTDAALIAVVERALRNYLAASPEELAADLTSNARVAVPDVRLTLQSLQRLGWATDRRSVLALAEAQDSRGARYTLAYELDVAEVDGRWEVSAVQMDPDG